MTLQERQEMLRRKYAKTVQVGAAGRTTNTARADRAANAGGGTGRGVQLDTAQRARLLQLFERHNASRHNVDVVAEGMKQPAAGGGGDATGAAATAEPVELSVGQVLKQLKAMGLRFGQLTERQLARLRTLHGRYREDPDMLLMVAGQMPGGWTSKDVKRLLLKHGLVEAKRRRKHDGDSDGAGGSGSDDPDAEALAQLDEAQLEDLWEQHKAKEDAVELITAALGHVASERVVARKLRKMGLLKKRAGGRRGGGGGGFGSTRADVERLRALWEEHRERPDALNMLSALLPGAPPIKQVQKLLRKHGIVEDDASRRKKARDAAERVRLVALYQQTRGSEDQLEVMAGQMPELAGGAKQVLKLLRKHGLVEGAKRTGGPGRTTNPEAAAGTAAARRRNADGDADADAAAANGRGRVPEPNAGKVLACLQAMEDVHDASSSYMDAARAAGWVCKQLDAAEALWARTAAGSAGDDDEGGAGQPQRGDFCLVMVAEEDDDFFMTDFAQDLLEAAGIRNDQADYYKVPGNSDVAWRSRVRAALQGALEQLGSAEAKQAAAGLVARLEGERAAETARRAAEAARDAALVLPFAGAADGGSGGKAKGKAANARAKVTKAKAAPPTAATAAARKAKAAAAKPAGRGGKGRRGSDARVSDDGSDEEEQQARHPEQGAGGSSSSSGEEEEAPARAVGRAAALVKRQPKAAMPARAAAATPHVADGDSSSSSGSGSSSGSENSSSDSSSSSSDGSGSGSESEGGEEADRSGAHGPGSSGGRAAVGAGTDAARRSHKPRQRQGDDDEEEELVMPHYDDTTSGSGSDGSEEDDAEAARGSGKGKGSAGVKRRQQQHVAVLATAAAAAAAEPKAAAARAGKGMRHMLAALAAGADEQGSDGGDEADGGAAPRAKLARVQGALSVGKPGAKHGSKRQLPARGEADEEEEVDEDGSDGGQPPRPGVSSRKQQPAAPPAMPKGRQARAKADGDGKDGGSKDGSSGADEAAAKRRAVLAELARRRQDQAARLQGGLQAPPPAAEPAAAEGGHDTEGAAAVGHDSDDDGDGGAVGVAKRRRLLKRPGGGGGAGGGKENVGADAAALQAGGKGASAGGGGHHEERQAVQLEDELEDY